MKKIVKELEKTIDKISGRLLCIGINNEYLLNKIKNNVNILYCDFLNADVGSRMKIGKKRKKHEKNISIKDFKKYFKKRRIDYTISNINDIEKYLPRFIPDSIYITKNFIYIYGDINYDYEKIVKKYKRYTDKIDVIKTSDSFLLKIDVTNTKSKYFKDKLYYIIDNLEIFADKIGDILVG